MNLQEKLNKIWDNCREKNHCKAVQLCWRCEVKVKKLKNEYGIKPAPTIKLNDVKQEKSEVRG